MTHAERERGRAGAEALNMKLDLYHFPFSFYLPLGERGVGERQRGESGATSNARRSVRQQIKFGHPERGLNGPLAGDVLSMSDQS